MELSRRAFTSSALGATLLVGAPGAPKRNIRISAANSSDPFVLLAQNELIRGLSGLFPAVKVGPGEGELEIRLAVEPGGFKGQESYTIARAGSGLAMTGASSKALLYSVFDLLERQGVFFGIDGESYPFDPPSDLAVPQPNAPWTGTPRFAVRGLLPWPDFLNCISVYNEEDFRAYFESMMRMRFNIFGMHVYTGANQWAESYLSFKFAGAGHLAYLDSSASNRWGYLPQRTSTFGMGAPQFYDGEIFGSDATRYAAGNWEVADKTQAMLKKALAYARTLGMRTGVGFEPYQIPDEILRALPPEVRLDPEKKGGARFDVESLTAKQMLEARLAELLEAYPDVDYVWLWEDEGMNWESRKTGVPLSVTPFRQAHDFLRRNAPKKRLVLSGWGGVARHFEYFDRQLPEDVVFSCLNDSLGWDQVHEVFGKLGTRERWPIPWLEDDPSMWLPQFHVNRFQKDLDVAAQYGCQGMIGIHWRHRIVDPTAGYMARYSWDPRLTPDAYYLQYARTQAAPPRAERLAAILQDADKKGRLLSTGSDVVKDGHIKHHEFAGDYGEGFMFWRDEEPDPKVMAAQSQVAAAIAELERTAASATEHERLAYLSQHIQLLPPYAEAWLLAHRIQGVLDQAAKLKEAGKLPEAKQLVEAEALPLWMQVPPKVRQTMLAFQSVATTRNDMGTLASMQNKFVRLALYRLPLSIQEYIGELPASVQAAVQGAVAPVAAATARVVVPTRPTILGRNDAVRISAIVLGADAPTSVTLETHSASGWTSTPMSLSGRRTYQATLKGAVTEYYVAAVAGTKKLTSPPEAPKTTYRVTLI